MQFNVEYRGELSFLTQIFSLKLWMSKEYTKEFLILNIGEY